MPKDQSVQDSAPNGLPLSPGDDLSLRKRRRFAWDNLSYTTRVTVAFAFIAAMTAVVAIGVVSFVWEQHFQTYTRDNMRSVAESTASQIATRYEETHKFDYYTLSPASNTLNVTRGIGIQVVSNLNGSNNVVYDSTQIYSESSDDHSPSKNMIPEAVPSLAPPQSQDNMQIASIKVQDENGTMSAVGSVRVWVYGSDTLLRSTDEEFRDKSYQAMFFAAAIAILLASCMGFLFARNLVSPINRMTKTAKAIKEGDLSARTQLRGEDEIARLGETFDAMAASVEKDRELERRLTTDVAHELRTPLMAIQSTVEAMVDGVFKANAEHLETVNSEVQRLSRLVDSLLKLSRLENRTKPMKTQVVDVGKLISGIVATHEAFVSDSGLTLHYEADENVFVRGDADMIRQATANLISNAVRYTPEGGFIDLSVRRGDLMASIAVKDTGIGLSPEEKKMVFSRFWRADAGRNRESGGLGIGLAVVKEIVDRHGGWVQVEGKRNEGACFTIHIPLCEESSQNRLRPTKPGKTKEKTLKSRAKGRK